MSVAVVPACHSEELRPCRATRNPQSRRIHGRPLVLLLLTLAPPAGAAAPAELTGELKQWHKVTLTLDGPFARERDTQPNPFLDYRLTVRFAHESGEPELRRARLLRRRRQRRRDLGRGGHEVARAPLARQGRPLDLARVVRAADRGPPSTRRRRSRRCPASTGPRGSFTVLPTDKTGRDFRAQGRLQYVGGHYLRFAGTRRVLPQGRRRRAGDAPRLRRLRRHRGHEADRPAQDLGAPRPRLAARRPDLEGRQGQGPDRRSQLPRGPRG